MNEIIIESKDNDKYLYQPLERKINISLKPFQYISQKEWVCFAGVILFAVSFVVFATTRCFEF
jgi:hypothetical protein